MAARVSWTSEALKDLDEIWLHIARDSIRGAEAILDRIDRAERQQSEHPLSGPARDDLRPGLRLWPVGNYVILYRSEAGRVTIVRVLWGGRDLGDLL